MSVIVFSSLLKLAGQQVLDAVNFGSNISGGESGDLANGGGVQSFQIRKDHVTVERLEVLNQSQQAIEILIAVRSLLPSADIWKALQFFQVDQDLRGRAALVRHVRRGDVMGDAIDPRANRTSAVESCETAPERHVNVLQQITADLRVGFVGASQTLQSGTASAGCVFIQRVLRCRLRDGPNCAHI